jgi:glycosyltransferase involved in cell wall biosynthesis
MGATERLMPTGASPQTTDGSASSQPPAGRRLQGKRVGMVVFSSYPDDPRPRRAVEALLKEGMTVDLICQGETEPSREVLDGLNISRVAVRRTRGGKVSYVYQYSVFILVSMWLFAVRSLKDRYDLIYVHNMPDVLVVSSVIPRVFGAKVILDQHDPMPELMMTIFNVDESSWGVRLLTWLEKWSLSRVDLVLTVNIACKRLFGSRSCPPHKIAIVMNSPDAAIFPFRPARSHLSPQRDRTRPFAIMYHGSLVERNGVDLAVDALVHLRETIPTAELRIYGRSTPYLKQVMDKVQRLDMANCVRYLGPKRLEQLAHEIEMCDVGVIPNHRNAFTDINTPTRIFEYLAMGKPVIAPSTPGILDYFGPESLFFFESGNARALAQKVEEVYSHPAVAARTAERGQQVYLAHAWQEERQTLVNLVSGLLDGGRL